MTMTALTMTSWVAVYLTLFYVAISIRVIRGRRRNKISVGDGQVTELTKLIRAHGNFAEYVPLALILMALCELKAANMNAVLIAAVLLCFGRTIHYCGVAQVKETFILRVAGMALTFSSLLILAFSLLLALL